MWGYQNAETILNLSSLYVEKLNSSWNEQLLPHRPYKMGDSNDLIRALMILSLYASSIIHMF